MKGKNLKSAHFLFLFCCILLLNGCKTQKGNLANSISGTKSKKEVIHDVLESSLQYKTIAAKGSVELVFGNSKKKLPATFKIEKDQAMQVSLRDPILGAVEVARITFTTDSIVVLDRYKQRFVAEKYSNLSFSKDIDFNYYNLQALLTNQMFAPGIKNISNNDNDRFKMTTNEEHYLATISDRNNMQYTFAIDGANNLTSTTIAHAQKNISLKWDYSDFVVEEKKDYPTTMSVEASMKQMKINFVVSYSKLDINKGLQIDITIPAKYKRVTFKEFIDSYIKL